MAKANTTSWGGPNPGASGSDPRGRLQNQSGYQQSRFENQQGPASSEFARQFGRAAETQYGDYGDIMKRYGDVAGGAGAGQLGRNQVSWSDPFKSYGGFEEFSQTGGYSPTDIANMRARGVSPIRAAYSNAQRNVSRQRSLQGGYSPNAISAQVKMAREQGQGMADATQNVEAGLAEARNKGRLSGLGGMSNIEGQRLNAQLDAGKFNANALNNADQYDQQNQLNALNGMTSLYGTTPGMANMFGNQLNTSIGQGSQYGIAQQGADFNSQQLPGQFDQTMGRVNSVANLANMGGNLIYPWLNRGQQQQPFMGPQDQPQFGYTSQQQQPMAQGNPQVPGFGGFAGGSDPRYNEGYDWMSNMPSYPPSMGYGQQSQQQPFMGPQQQQRRRY